MGGKSYHLRLVLWSWVVLAALAGAAFWHFTRQAEADIVRESEARAQRRLDLAGWLLSGRAPFAGPEAFDAWVIELGRRMSTRLTFISGGRVLAESDVDPAGLDRLEDHSQRPEVVAALRTGRGSHIRRSATLNKEMVYVAARLEGVPGLPDGILRLAVPFSEVRGSLDKAQAGILAVLLPILAISALATWWVLRRMAGVIRNFSDTVRAIGEGDFDRRVRDFPGREFAVLAESINSMARRIKAHMKTIRDQASRMGAVFDGLAEGVAVIGPDGRITAHNKALRAIFPGSLSPDGRFPLEAGLPLESQQAVDQLLADPAAPDPVVRQIQTGDASFLEASAVPYLDHKDRRGLILVFHDISDIKRVEGILRDFVANASHQLRTPLTSIKGFAEVLLDMPPEDPEKGREIMATILRNADHMSKVITSMFTLAKSRFMAERGRALPTNGRSALTRAAETVAARVAERRGELDFSGVPEMGAVVLADDDALIQVFANLLENALKYGPDQGRVEVSFLVENGRGSFRFRDRGPGIPESERERVFERFYRVDRNSIDLGGGAGLGLAICRDIVAGFGGEIFVESPPDGAGAVFVVRLPMA